MNSLSQKSNARHAAKLKRGGIHDPVAKIGLIRHFPTKQFSSLSVGGYWPLGDEIDVRPLMQDVLTRGHDVGLPCTPPRGQGLTYRFWGVNDDLVPGLYGTSEPHSTSSLMTPGLLLVPLLAFNDKGERLGYGGGYYDRTLAALRATGNVFACGVAYAGQETAELPVDAHDERLDGILTEDYFKVF